MYRDTVGKVTVGVGLMLPDAAAAQALPFQIGARAATTAEIVAEYDRVMRLAAGKAADFYRQAASTGAGLELAEATIDAKLMAVLEGYELELKARLSGYDGFPEGVKLALLDMAYNLGPQGLFAGYPRLIAAVRQGAWAQAAAECARHGPSAARNAWTRQQFLGAVVGTIKAEAESWGWRVAGWWRGLWAR
jgi:GH24 family phage-related lysozyme (muramidase)